MLCSHRDAIPVFVHHHNAQEHTKREEEESVDVMLDSIANGDTESEQDDLRDGKECGAENDVSNRPSVLKCAEDENQLRDDVDDCADKRPQDINYPQSDRFCVFETSEVLESCDGDEKTYTEHNKA